MKRIKDHRKTRLDVQLSSSPVSSLSVVSDLVVGLQSDPLRQRSVLLGSFSQLLLGSERFVSLSMLVNIFHNLRF